MTQQEINDYARNNGFKGSLIDSDEVKKWNACSSPKEALLQLCSSRDALFRSIKVEFQASHSAMSPEGAEAYADNWN